MTWRSQLQAGLTGWRHLLAGFLAAVILLALGGFLFAWSGLYNIGASTGHWWITRQILVFGLESSVRTHSFGVEAPPLDDHDMIQLGAAHFARACASCHGATGEPVGPVPGAMTPPPPHLASLSSRWNDAELFWIVRHGIKYTGMPAWPDLNRADEVWPVVAFLRRTPGMATTDFRALAGLPDGQDAPPAGGPAADSIDDCAACHGARGEAPNALVPSLAGQSQTYLAASLRAYADGSRFSGIMRPVAEDLNDEEIAALAAHYARQDKPDRAADTTPPDEMIARGRQIFAAGVSAEGVPACSACHGATRDPRFPMLHGLSARYLTNQLNLFRTGDRGDSAFTRIMEVIAGRLTERQIQAVAAYLEGASQEDLADLSPSRDAGPAP